MTAPTPILCEWTGEEMKPANSLWARRADQQWVVGERYLIEIRQERSEAAHRHEFAWLHEAWMNLPQHLADQFPSPEHLRKRALIAAGYYTEEIIDCGGKAAALRVAAFAGKDDFAAVVVRGPIVVVRTAKSQSRRAMNREEFAASKSDLMDVIVAMIGVAPDQLKQASSA